MPALRYMKVFQHSFISSWVGNIWLSLIVWNVWWNYVVHDYDWFALLNKRCQSLSPSLKDVMCFCRSYASKRYKCQKGTLSMHICIAWSACLDSTLESESTLACILLSTLTSVASDLLNDALRLDNELSAWAATCSLRSVTEVTTKASGRHIPL